MPYTLTGVDSFDPRPGILRELQVAQGDSGAGGRARQAVMLANMATGIGSGSVDGLGDALNVPRLITSRQDVIDRAGYHSEALVGHDAFRAVNTQTDLYLLLSAPGAGAASATLTFATAATASGAVRISLMGETVEVGIASGDAIGTVASAVAAKINAQLHWPVTAAAALGVVTVTAGFVGTRGDAYLNSLRASMKRPNVAMTVTKSAVTPGSTDDDQTAAIAALDAYEIYYQVNPKTTTGAVTATDNGIGEHITALTAHYAPASGKAEELFVGVIGTNAQAITTAVSINSHIAKVIWAEDNDFSPLMLAATAAGVQAKEEASDRGRPIFTYGPGGDGSPLPIPDPFDVTDRPTATEVKAALNNGISPVEFTATGKALFTWLITSRSETNSVKDYRARAGHIPSVIADYWETLRIRYSSTKQLRVAADRAKGEKPLPGFTYPADVAALMRSVIDDKIDGARATLDPAQRAAMKASVDATLAVGGAGVSAIAQLQAVKPNLKGHFLIQEVSPEV